MKKCPNGHYYEGDACPYCPTRYYPNYDPTLTADPQPHKPTFYPRDTPTSTAAGTDIPLCPHCGRPLRKSVPMPPKGVRISSINHMGDGIVPWNYEWDGNCENCGHDYNVVMQINMGSTGPDNKIRETEIKVGANGFMHDITANLGEGSATVLSGVEITTKCGHDHSEKLFLSANELKHLMKVLQNSPILKQFDYYVEDNEKNKYRT